MAAAASVDRFFELSIIGLVASGYFALFGSGFLDTLSCSIASLTLLCRVLQLAGIMRDVSLRAANWALAAYLGFYAVDAAFLAGTFFAATVHLVFFTAGLKLISARRSRDYVLVSVLAFIALLSAAILSANLTFFVFLTLFVLFAVSALAAGEIRGSIREPHTVTRTGVRWLSLRIAASAAWMAVGVFALTGGLFFILPRTAQAAFGRFLPQRIVSGFSGEIRLGETGEIETRGTAVMHVHIIDGHRPPGGLKLRGMVLTRFDGRRWYNPPRLAAHRKLPEGQIQLVDNEQRWRQGQRLSYEVRVAPMGAGTLFFAGIPEFLRIDEPELLESPFGDYRVPGRPRGLLYFAQSFVDGAAASGGIPGYMPPEMRELYLALPAVDPRIPELVRRITAGMQSDHARAAAIESYLRRSYGYTTRLLSHEVRDPLADFLFDRRKGHCEYFASAMAVMLRSAGIPARVATGFQDGVYNPISGWWVVRAQDAHSWVEAWLPDRGWTTFDATPPAAAPAASTWGSLLLYLDAADTFWQDWVLDYNLGHQLVLASRMQQSAQFFGNTKRAMSDAAAAAEAWIRRYGIVLAVILALAFVLRRYGSKLAARFRAASRVRQVQRGQAQPGDATILYEQMLGALKRRGLEKPSWVTPAEFVGHIRTPETAAIVGDFTAAYNGMRFGGRIDAAARMVELLGALERRS